MRITKSLAIFFLVIGCIGFLDATYLTVEHYIGAIPPCLAAGGCETVLTSEWSTISGLPVSLWGALYYLVLLLLSVIYLKNDKKGFIVSAAGLSTIGFIISIWLVCLQIFIIKHICFYCMISAATSTVLFITGMVILFKSKIIPPTSSQ